MEKQDLLMKGLDAEFKAIAFYVNNLKNLNYAQNRTQVDILVLESLEHATGIAKELLKLNEGTGGGLDPKAVSQAFAEEMGMAEIYKYELKETDLAEVRELMAHLVKEEERHQKLLDSLR